MKLSITKLICGLALVLHVGVSPLHADAAVQTDPSPSTQESKLLRAVEQGAPKATRQLLESGADPNTKFVAQYFGPRTALCIAAEEGHQAVVQELLAGGADPDLVCGISRPLTTAAGEGHQDIVSVLVDAGANINGTNSDGDSALTLTAIRRHPTVIRALLVRGADVNFKGGSGRSALRNAILHHFSWVPDHRPDKAGDRLSTIRLLIAAGADIEDPGPGGATLLMDAATWGDTETVRWLIEAGAKIEARDRRGNTVLIRAASDGAAAAVSTLLRAGADIEARNREGIAPLMAAVARSLDLVDDSTRDLVVPEQRATVGTLLAAGADPLAADVEGRNALDHTLEAGNLEFVELLTAHCSGSMEPAAKVEVDLAARTSLDNQLLRAAEAGDQATVARLLVSGANPNVSVASHWFGETPLMLAAGRAHTEVVKLLLSSKAEVNARSAAGSTALIKAAGAGALCDADDVVKTVRLLIEHGADVNAAGLSGWNALMLAARDGNLRVVRTLLEHGVDVNHANQDGMTALMLAASCAQVEVVEVLLAAGAKTDARHRGGLTALMLASSLQDEDDAYGKTLRALVGGGADVNARDEGERTALMQLASNGGLGVKALKALLKAGANGTLRDRQGRTAQDQARKAAHQDFVRELEFAPDGAVSTAVKLSWVFVEESLSWATPIMESALKGMADPSSVEQLKRRFTAIERAAEAFNENDTEGYWAAIKTGLRSFMEAVRSQDALNTESAVALVDWADSTLKLMHSAETEDGASPWAS